MRFSIPFTFLLLSCCLFKAQAQNHSPSQANVSDEAVQLKAVKTPFVPYPEEAHRNHVEGKVTLSIVVDEKGNVSQARVLSGPMELQSAALQSVRMWQYEPPASPPVTKTVEVAYGFPKECPGPVSDHGTVEGRWALLDRDGKLVAVAKDDPPLPYLYSEEQRKSGIAGTLVLSISLHSDGRVKEIHVVQSLSPALDESYVDLVRKMKFRRDDPNSIEPLKDLRLRFTFRAMCIPHF
jgi:TonB family protein